MLVPGVHFLAAFGRASSPANSHRCVDTLFPGCLRHIVAIACVLFGNVRRHPEENGAQWGTDSNWTKRHIVHAYCSKRRRRRRRRLFTCAVGTGGQASAGQRKVDAGARRGKEGSGGAPTQAYVRVVSFVSLIVVAFKSIFRAEARVPPPQAATFRWTRTRGQKAQRI